MTFESLELPLTAENIHQLLMINRWHPSYLLLPGHPVILGRLEYNKHQNIFEWTTERLQEYPSINLSDYDTFRREDGNSPIILTNTKDPSKWARIYIDKRVSQGFIGLYEDSQLPTRETRYSAATDVYAYEDKVILPGRTELVRTGITSYMEEDIECEVYTRGSLPINKGLLIPNAPGSIGCNSLGDEIKVMFYNFSTVPVELCKGDKIAQLKFRRLIRPNDEIIIDADRKDGFGSKNANN
jgi:dUTP pyrophosphatase